MYKNSLLTNALLEGFQELGFDEVDYNGKSQIGYSRKQTYLSKNIRAGTNYSYIKPAAARPNLLFTLDSLATKIIIENRRAVGVEFVKNGLFHRANAIRNVIVSAGAINSPQVLMLSGIGPAKELKKHGIEVLADLPVGQNLHDQVCTNFVVYSTDQVLLEQTLNESINLWTDDKGPLLGNAVVGFSDYDNDTIPEIQYFFTQPYIVDENYNFVLSSFLAVLNLLHPNSIGEVTLASNDARDFPLLNSNIFSNETDLELLYEGVQNALKFNSTLAFQKLGLSVYLDDVSGCDENFVRLSKEWWFCTLKHLALPSYHATGTTRMGTDPFNSVVDSKLKVHGIKNLRVVDAGVCPFIVSGPTNAAVVVIAEKAADIIKSEYIGTGRIQSRLNL